MRYKTNTNKYPTFNRGTGSNRGTAWVEEHAKNQYKNTNKPKSSAYDWSNRNDMYTNLPNNYSDAGGVYYSNNSGINDKPQTENLADQFVSKYGGGSGSGSYVKFGDPYDLDLSIFDQMMKTLGDNYNRSKGVLADQLKNALDSLANSRKRGNQNFHAGRATIAENSFDRQRAMLNDLASRGLAGSGLQQLGDVQEAMAKGREVSNLASKFYEFLDRMQENETKARSANTASLVNLENAYNSGIASIGQQKWQAKNQYDRDMMNRMDEMARFNAQMGARQNAERQGLADMYDNISAKFQLARDLASTGDIDDIATAEQMVNTMLGGDYAQQARDIMNNSTLENKLLRPYIINQKKKHSEEK